MAIAWNTGTTVDDGNTATTSKTVTIPGGVNADDVILLVATGWDTAAATETIQASSTGTAPTIIGSSESLSFAGVNIQGAVFYVVAGASDAGKVITVSFVSGDTAKWDLALGAWSGVSNASPVDASAAITNGGTGATLTEPTVITNFAGDWCIELAAVALAGSAYGGGTGFTQRESNVDGSSGGGAFIWDSNGTVTSPAGGATFTNAGNSWWIGFTVALEPPSTGIVTHGSVALAGMGLDGSGSVAGGSNTSTGSVALAPLAMGATVAVPAPPLSAVPAIPGLLRPGYALPGDPVTGEAVTSTGSLALAPMALASTAKQVNTSSGSIALAPLAESGTAVNSPAGAAFGSMALPSMGMAGSAQSFSCSGSLALTGMGLSGDAAEAGSTSATGSLALPGISLDVQAHAPQTVTSSGSLALKPMAIASPGGIIDLYSSQLSGTVTSDIYSGVIESDLYEGLIG